MEVRYVWTDQGVEFTNGAAEPCKLQFVSAKSREVEEFGALLEEVGRVYGLLRAARNSFASGQADYTDAADNASVLMQELDKAGAKASAIAHGIDVFFDPPEASKHLQGDRLIAFAAEAVQRIKTDG